MKLLTVLLACLLTASLMQAATGVALTVYNDNLALVRDTRMMDFKKGNGELLFRDVSGQIDATSVHFRAQGVDLLEQNFDYDLVSPDKLLEKYVDQQIEVVSKTGEVAKGTLLASGAGFGGGQAVVQQADGSLRSISAENTAEIRFPNLPEGLITRPTLRWLVNADDAGKKEAEVSYLTAGLSWRADYVLVIEEVSPKSDLSAWVTLTNACGADYKSAQLKLMAGEVHRAMPPRPQYAQMDMMAKASAMGERQFEEKTLFEYHLYALKRPTDVLDKQTKQVSLFPNTTITTYRLYEYDWQRKQDRVGVMMEFENKEQNALGMPLPAGRVRVYQKSPDGSQEFVGEDNIEHTPKNEKVRVQVGEAFDIAVERTQKDFRRISDRVSETDFEIKLRNHKKDAVEIIVVDHFYGDWEILKSSVEAKKISAYKVEFRQKVEPEQEAVLTYTVRTR